MYSMHQQTAFAVQAELKKIGIDVTLDLPDWATRIEKNTKGEYDFLVAGKRISKSPGILEFPVRNND